MNNITKEQIDDAFKKAAENNLENFQKQFLDAIEQVPAQKDNPIAREVLAASLAQANVMAAMKDVITELLISE